MLLLQHLVLVTLYAAASVSAFPHSILGTPSSSVYARSYKDPKIISHLSNRPDEHVSSRIEYHSFEKGALRRRAALLQVRALTQAQIAQKKVAGTQTKLDRQADRAANAKNQIPVFSGQNGKKLYYDYAKPQAAEAKLPGKTRVDRQDFSKPSTGVDKTNPTNTIHMYRAGVMPGKTVRIAGMRADAERVVGEYLRHPSNPITHGAGPKAANTVIRAGEHSTHSTGPLPGLIDAPGTDNHNDVSSVGKLGAQKLVTSVIQDPSTKERKVVHLPMITNPRDGTKHYDNRQQHEHMEPGTTDKNDVPPPPSAQGSRYYPRKRSILIEFDDVLNTFE